MRKQNKNILITIVILSVLFLLVKYSLPFAIPSTANPIQPFPLNLIGSNASSFTCDSDYCLVSGSINIDSPSQADIVIFRFSGSYNSDVYIDTNEDSLLELAKFVTTGSKRASGRKLFNAPTGYSIYLETGGLYIYTGSNPETAVTSFYKYSLGSSGSGYNYDSFPHSSPCPNTLEICVKREVYSADYNFCPTGDSNFAYCNGNNQYTPITKIPQIYSTPEIELSKFGTLKSISFLPTKGDGTPITSKSLLIKKYDSSTCETAIASGNACDNAPSNQNIKCVSSQSCPSGYTFRSSAQCAYLNGAYNYYNTQQNVCIDSAQKCLSSLSPDYTKYVKCTETKIINGVSCGDWGTTQFTAPSGQECFLIIDGVISNQHAPGNPYQSGGLKCPNTASCLLGTKQGIDNSVNYLECVYADVCHNELQQKTCPTPKVWNNELNSCTCPIENRCNSLAEKQCTGTKTYKQCSSIGQGCFAWSNTLSTCSGELFCEDNPGNYDNCNCNPPTSNKCTPGEIKCTSKTNYQPCKIEDVNTQCYDFRGDFSISSLGYDTNSYECLINSISPRTDIGCAYPSNIASEICSSDKDSRKILLESCDNANNLCVSTIDDYSATSTDTVKCSANTVYYAKKYSALRSKGSLVDIYRWEVKSDAPNSLNGVCKANFICSSGVCQSIYTHLGITAPDLFGVGLPINGIKVFTTLNVPSEYSSIFVHLFEKVGNDYVELPSTRKILYPSQVGNLKEAVYDSEYSFPSSREIKIEAVAIRTQSDITTSQYRLDKIIQVAKRLDVKLSCPANGYVGRESQCTWSVVDLDNNAIVSTANCQPTIEPQIPFNSGISSGVSYVKFTPTSLGSILVRVNCTASGYISNSDQYSYSIIDPTDVRTQTFSLDNKDFFSYPTGISTGTHQLKLAVDEAGVPADISLIIAKIRNPTGNEKEVTFTKQADGSYVAVEQFTQPGSTYKLFGEIRFLSLVKPPVQFEYQITTSKSVTEDITLQLIVYGIIGAISLIIIIVTIVLVVRANKGRK